MTEKEAKTQENKQENKEVEESKEKKVKPVFYKDYDIKWLRGVPEHPDYYLVAEYDKEYNGS